MSKLSVKATEPLQSSRSVSSKKQRPESSLNLSGDQKAVQNHSKINTGCSISCLSSLLLLIFNFTKRYKSLRYKIDSDYISAREISFRF